jgi:hypothetical protein
MTGKELAKGLGADQVKAMGIPIDDNEVILETKKQVNERREKEIAEAISTPEGRMILAAKMWFPLEQVYDHIAGETELQWAKRKIAQMQKDVEEYDKQLKKITDRKELGELNENI